MGQCKCRKCGEVASSKAWAAGKQATCPHCGHGHFSLSFQTKAPPQRAEPEAVPDQADAHGRRRKVIRLANFTSATPSFRDRMRGYQGPANTQSQDDD